MASDSAREAIQCMTSKVFIDAHRQHHNLLPLQGSDAETIRKNVAQALDRRVPVRLAKTKIRHCERQRA